MGRITTCRAVEVLQELLQKQIDLGIITKKIILLTGNECHIIIYIIHERI